MHLYEIDSDRGIYWEVHDESGYLATLVGKTFDDLLDYYHIKGVDFVLHELGGVDEYHYALPSV